MKHPPSNTETLPPGRWPSSYSWKVSNRRDTTRLVVPVKGNSAARPLGSNVRWALTLSPVSPQSQCPPGPFRGGRASASPSRLLFLVPSSPPHFPTRPKGPLLPGPSGLSQSLRPSVWSAVSASGHSTSRIKQDTRVWCQMPRGRRHTGAQAANKGSQAAFSQPQVFAREL